MRAQSCKFIAIPICTWAMMTTTGAVTATQNRNWKCAISRLPHRDHATLSG